MASECENIESLHRIEAEDNEDMRSQSNMSDRLVVEVDCHSLGSNECPSMGSSFSPLESPTPTPTSIYSQGSISPGWQDSASYPGHAYERGTGASPIRGPFHLTSLPSHEHMPYSNLDGPDRMGMADFLPGYDENVDQFWIPSDVPKTYDHHIHGLPYPPAMQQYPPMMRSNYRHHPAPYMPESVTNPCLSRPIFHHQAERLTTSLSMSHIMPWMAHAESISPETIAPSQVAPVTPPPSYTDFPNSINFRTHSPATPNRSCSLGTGSGADTPMSRFSGGAGEYLEYQQSPVYRDTPGVRLQRQPSRKVTRKQCSKQSLSLENLPAVIKQVQFKCKEPGCKGRFKRQEHLKRHMKSHSKEKPHICWVPGCHRAFSRSDNLNAHYTKTHSKRGGRNRYVATLDETSPDYNPDYRGPLTADGRPMRGSAMDDSIPDGRDIMDGWDE